MISSINSRALHYKITMKTLLDQIIKGKIMWQCVCWAFNSMNSFVARTVPKKHEGHNNEHFSSPNKMICYFKKHIKEVWVI